MLYVSHQKTTGHEGARNKALQKLEDDNFNFIILSKNSKWFKQELTNEDDKMYSSFDLYQKRQIEEIFNKAPEESGYYISPSIRSKFKKKTGIDIEKWTESAIKELYQKLYPKSNGNILKDDRKILNQILYTVLTLKINEVLEIDYFVNPCKDNADRGPSESTKHFFLTKIASGEALKIEDVEALCFSRAAMAKKRSILDEHFTEMVTVLDFALSNQKGIKEVFNTLFPETKVVAEKV